MTGGGHGAAVRPGERVVGPLDGLAPEAKLVGLVAFLLVSAVTPSGRFAVLAAHAAVAVAVAAVAAVPARTLARRFLLDVPLLVLALTYAAAGRGPRTSVLGISLSVAGLEVGSSMVIKATIGIIAVSALAATTSLSETVLGLRRLGVPAWFTDLVGLSARQAGVLGADIERLRLAASVRGRGIRSEWMAVVRALGITFVRATERADRLQLAAQARGGTTLGSIVVEGPSTPAATTGSKALASLPAAAALATRLLL